MLAWLGLGFLLCSPLAAQDREAELRRRIEKAVVEEVERLRADLAEIVRRELRGPVAPATPGLEAACARVTADLLREHATFLAGDDLEGRAAGFPGNDKATEYISDVMRKAGLKPAGDGGSYYQKFRMAGRETRNCLGLLEGTDPELKNEIVVVGAHHDHVGTADQPNWGRLGRAEGGDRIWNGADDNASGTSSVLGVIRAFGEGGVRTKRSILFMTFSGEEAGLLGSEYYMRHPLAPVDQHVFMLNLDMVGRNPQKPMEIHGVGSAEGGVLRRVVERSVERSGLKAKLHEQVALVGGDSDHSSFQSRRIPFCFFFSGFHADYHRATDHPEKLAYDNMVKVAHSAVYILEEVANAVERPRFMGRSGGAFKFADPGEAPGPTRRLGVTVAELDDAECGKLGLEAGRGALRVDGVAEGSVAAAAGILPGDFIVSMAGVELPRLESRSRLRETLDGKVKPGKPAAVGLLRGGRPLTLQATWKD